jgi:hypothetical protein
MQIKLSVRAPRLVGGGGLRVSRRWQIWLVVKVLATLAQPGERRLEKGRER